MAELLVFGLLPSTTELSGMPKYQVPVKGNCIVHTFLIYSLMVYMMKYLVKSSSKWGKTLNHETLNGDLHAKQI